MSVRKSSKKSAKKLSAALSTMPARPFQASFDKTEKARNALAPGDEWPVNRDVPTVITTILGALPTIVTLRESIATALPEFDLRTLDELPTYIEALACAHSRYVGEVASGGPLPDLFEEASALRDRLFADSTALVKRKLISGDFLKEVKGGLGYFNVGLDLSVITGALRKSWPLIVNRTGVTTADLERGEELYQKITRALAVKTRPTQASAAATEDRNRAYSLVMEGYSQVRRAVTYVRWDADDVEHYVPPLGVGAPGHGRGRPKSAAASPGTGDGAAANGAQAPATPPVPTAPTTPTAPPPTSTSTQVGMRNSSPFTNN